MNKVTKIEKDGSGKFGAFVFQDSLLLNSRWFLTLKGAESWLVKNS